MKDIKYLVLLIASLLFLTSSPDCHASILDDAQKALVSIEIPVDGEWVFSGSGTLIESGKGSYGVLTALHVLDDEETVRVCGFESKQCVLADAYSRLGALDAAYVPVDRRIAEPIRNRKGRVPRLGDTVYVASLPMDMPVAFKGSVVGFESGRFLVLGYAYPGSSGSCVLDSKGRIIGVLVAVPLAMSPIPSLQSSIGIIEPLAR